MKPPLELLPQLNELDREILRVLHSDGRASWGSIADEVGSSTSTVRRRFEALQSQGLVRVIGRTDVSKLGLGVATMLEFRGRDASHIELLRFLQNRTDIRYLSAMVGSAGCLAEIVSPTLFDVHLAVDEITRAFDVSVEPFVVTHTYTSGQDWLPGTVERTIEVDIAPRTDSLSLEERIVLGMLLSDGRTSLSDLASGIDKSESTARRIMESLQERNLLSFRVLVEPQTLGFESEFWIWFDVEPSHIADIGATLASHQATKTLFTVAGRYDLMGQFVLPRHADLHAFHTELLGSLQGLRGAETMLQTNNFKRVWNMVDRQQYHGVLGPEWLFGMNPQSEK